MPAMPSSALLSSPLLLCQAKLAMKTGGKSSEQQSQAWHHLGPSSWITHSWSQHHPGPQPDINAITVKALGIHQQLLQGLCLAQGQPCALLWSPQLNLQKNAQLFAHCKNQVFYLLYKASLVTAEAYKLLGSIFPMIMEPSCKQHGFLK